jgi:uncharacterized protein
MPNHLANQNSPYLLQHASNPVDWYPWGQEALDRARRENKPIFLSIGYAACHWCHVMAHESFEDAQTAELLNGHFISIKVDREQRPDLDSIYMQATQSLSGSGGWPMSVFLTPDLQPFYAGTYFPSVRRYNMPAFREVLASIARAWQEDPGELSRVGTQVLAQLKTHSMAGPASQISPETLEDVTSRLIESYDHEHGGWGAAPKFPQPMLIDFLLQRAAYEEGTDSAPARTAFHALNAMARGGMYDVVGGGFSRYSTDVHWRVPHFEKMLYDNAQLAVAYLHAWKLSHNAFYREVVIETLDFVMRELMHPLGGFYSSLDADSDGQEGAFYVWTMQEIRDALDEDGLLNLVVAAYNITERGNWEGRNVLQRALDDATLTARLGIDAPLMRNQLCEAHARLLKARAARVRPTTDDKVLAGWNGLMLRAFAQASRFLDDPKLSTEYLNVATRSGTFLVSEMWPDGSLRRSWRNGTLSDEVFLEDHAAVILGLLDLYQAGLDNRWYAAAIELANDMLRRYADPAGGFFDTPNDAETLPVRPKDLQDNAVPSGNALACEALLRLAALGAEGSLSEIGHGGLQLVANAVGRYPTAFGHWLSTAGLALAGEQQLAIVYPPETDPSPLLRVTNDTFRPNLVVAVSKYPPPGEAPGLLAERLPHEGRPTAYVCHGFACKLPVTSPDDLLKQL